MKTNKLFNIFSAAVILLGFSACEKTAPKYEPAEKPTTSEVYFSSSLPSNYDITSYPTYFLVTINRSNSAVDYTANISSTADIAFSIPPCVNFSAGLTGTSIKISYDPSKLEDGKKYQFTLKAESEASQYGNSTYSFTATYTAPKQDGGSDWNPVTGTTPVFVENIMKVYNSGIDTHTFECYVEKYKDKEIYRIVNPMSVKVVNGKKYQNPYYDETGTKDGIWPKEFLNTDDYYITLDMDGAIFAEEIGGTLKDGEVYVANSNLNFQWEDVGPFNIVSAIAWPASADYGVGNWLGSYNATKKCISFNDYLLRAGSSVLSFPTYSGVATSYLYFDKSLMKENYNEYKYTDYAQGTAYSALFGAAGNPLPFLTDVKYWIDESVEEGNNCVYYLPNYFSEGYGLAFMAPDPDALKDGDAISDVANEQEIGEVFGTNVCTNIKKGTVTIGEDGMPIFDIQIDVYALQDGKRVLDYGKYNEKVVVNAFVEIYTDKDIIPAESKDKYLGTFSFKSNDYYNAGGAIVESIYPITIEDAGKDKQGDWVAVTGLTGTGDADTVFGTFENGFIYLRGQVLDEPMYGYKVNFAPLNSAAKQYDLTNEVPLLLGFVPNGKLAIVNAPDSPFDGCYFYCEKGGIALMWGYVLAPLADEAAAAVKAPKAKAQFHEFASPEMNIITRKLNLNSGVKHVENGKNANVQPIAIR